MGERAANCECTVTSERAVFEECAVARGSEPGIPIASWKQSESSQRKRAVSRASRVHREYREKEARKRAGYGESTEMHERAAPRESTACSERAVTPSKSKHRASRLRGVVPCIRSEPCHLICIDHSERSRLCGEVPSLMSEPNRWERTGCWERAVGRECTALRE
jgi:hypothetical protein